MANIDKNWDFDKWSENYDETVLDENWIHDGYTDVTNKVAKEILEFSGEKSTKILDIGAGTGNLISKLQPYKNLEFTAIEPSKGMRGKLIEKCGDVKVIDGMLPDLPEPETKFDVIVSTYAIHHVEHENSKLMVDNICKYAGENCLVIFADVMFENKKTFDDHIQELKSKNMTDRIDDLEDEYFQYVDVLSDAFEAHGFSVKNKRYNFYTHIFEALR